MYMYLVEGALPVTAAPPRALPTVICIQAALKKGGEKNGVVFAAPPFLRAYTFLSRRVESSRLPSECEPHNCNPPASAVHRFTSFVTCFVIA